MNSVVFWPDAQQCVYTTTTRIPNFFNSELFNSELFNSEL